jgi:uncharacterized protein YndB with AHSA1/START domain
MTRSVNRHAGAVAEFADGVIRASVEIAAPPERVFQALASKEIVDWWIRPGVFDTREWEGDVRVGGRWRAAGMGNGRPYALEGEFLELDPPRKLVHTWHAAGAPGTPSIVTYVLDAIEGGTRLTLRHQGIASPPTGANTGAGWKTSLERLAEILGG